MQAQIHHSAGEFGGVVASVYHADPVLFTLELSTLALTPWPTDRILLSVRAGEHVLGAAVQGHNSVLLVSGLPPDTATVAAAALVEDEAQLNGIRGTPAAAAGFVAAWNAVARAGMVPVDREVLYGLADLRLPTGVTGRARPAERSDAPAVVRWLDAFFVEAFGEPSNVDASAVLLDSINQSGHQVVLWSVAGEPVSMARVHTPILGVGRIGPVYTPPAYRARGYGAAVTAAAAEVARRGGATAVMLFADADNLAANRIYGRIGFAPVAENVRYAVGCGVTVQGRGRAPLP